MNGNNIPILLSAILDQTIPLYFKQYSLRPFLIRPDGTNPQFPLKHPSNLPVIVKARVYGLQEAIRWGEPHVGFLLPNVVFWTIPLENHRQMHGGLVGGEVAIDRDPYSHIETVNHLTANGCPRNIATAYINGLPVWEDQAKIRESAEYLFKIFYQISGWNPDLLHYNHAKQVQQRQIAEEIHQIKRGLHASSPREEERHLLSLMKAGDIRAARGELNRTLGLLFNQTANFALLQAQLIEMMGYLVRSAIEDNPAMENLMESNHRWMAKIIQSTEFEDLTRAVQESLDDFMSKMALHGHTRSGKTVSRILDWLSNHYHEAVTLAQLSKEIGLSSFRIAHLLKESTGKTMLQHVHRLRIQEAQRLLEQSALNCADIAYEVGFNDQSYFIKQFRRWMGISPYRYRKMIHSHQKPERRQP